MPITRSSSRHLFHAVTKPRPHSDLAGHTFVVRVRPSNRLQGTISGLGLRIPCALGRGGITRFKREGDGATPAVRLRVMHGFYRSGTRIAVQSALGFAEARKNEGWCDSPKDANYNQPVLLPYAASHETLMRDDHLYDIVLVLDWNIRPAQPGQGSAIFFHLARPGYTPTEGCIAVSRRDMLRLLPYLSRGAVLEVRS